MARIELCSIPLCLLFKVKLSFPLTGNQRHIGYADCRHFRNYKKAPLGIIKNFDVVKGVDKFGVGFGHLLFVEFDYFAVVGHDAVCFVFNVGCLGVDRAYNAVLCEIHKKVNRLAVAVGELVFGVEILVAPSFSVYPSVPLLDISVAAVFADYVDFARFYQAQFGVRIGVVVGDIARVGNEVATACGVYEACWVVFLRPFGSFYGFELRPGFVEGNPNDD